MSPDLKSSHSKHQILPSEKGSQKELFNLNCNMLYKFSSTKFNVMLRETVITKQIRGVVYPDQYHTFPRANASTCLQETTPTIS